MRGKNGEETYATEDSIEITWIMVLFLFKTLIKNQIWSHRKESGGVVIKDIISKHCYYVVELMNPEHRIVDFGKRIQHGTFG